MFRKLGLFIFLSIPGATYALDAGLVSYHGSHIFHRPKIEMVVWDGWHYDFPEDQLSNAINSITGSDYVSRLNDEYGTPAGKTIVPGYLDQTVTVTPSLANDPVFFNSEHYFRKVLTVGINSGALPRPGGNKVYAIFLPPGKSGTAIRQVCGYHSHFFYRGSKKVPPQWVYYIIIPDATNYKGCGEDSFSALTITFSHELAEVITDSDLSGWFDDLPEDPHSGEEIADMCESVSGEPFQGSDGAIYKVEKIYQNSTGLCF